MSTYTWVQPCHWIGSELWLVQAEGFRAIIASWGWSRWKINNNKNSSNKKCDLYFLYLTKYHRKSPDFTFLFRIHFPIAITSEYFSKIFRVGKSTKNPAEPVKVNVNGRITLLKNANDKYYCIKLAFIFF